MSKSYEVQKQIKNEKGKLLLQKTKLEYSKVIVEVLNNNPQLVEMVKEKMEISDDELWNVLSGKEDSNIVFYDQALEILTHAKRK